MVISIYPLLSNAHNFSPFFFFALLPPSPLPRCFTFLACGLRAPGIPIRFAECTRLYEAHNGKRRFNASLADNRFEYQQLRTLISPCMDPRFEPTHGARPMGLTFPITGRLGFWKTPAPLPRVAWPRTWCTSRQDAPARTCRAFCDSGRSECAAGTCTTATWCEVSSNSLQTEIRAVTDRSSIVRKIWEKKYRVSPKNFHGKRARVTFDYIINVRGETDKEKQKKKWKLEARQFFLNANIYIYMFITRRDHERKLG